MCYTSGIIFTIKEGNMATKKSASSVKRKTVATPKAPKTKVTTVKAVESGSARRTSALLSTRGAFQRMPIMSASIAEFIGAFLLAIVVLRVQNDAFYVLFALVGVFMLIGGLSGAHLNPAVTIGAWVSRRIGWMRALSYMVAQFLGAMLALVVMQSFLNQAPDVSAEAAQFGQTAPELFTLPGLPEGKEWTVFAAEVIGLMILGFAYASVLRPAVKDKLTGAFTVGGSGFLALIFATTAAGYAGAAVALNPAIAVTLDAIDFSNVWTLVVRFVAPLLGAIIGFFLYDFIKDVEAES